MKKLLYILSIITLSLTFSSCESEISILEISEELGFTGSTEDIREFLGADVYDAMIEKGLIINPGSTPLNLEGTYQANPYCRIPDDGDPFCFTNSSWFVTFSNQNNDNLTINYFAQQIEFITGNIIGQESGSGRITGDSSGAFTVMVNATTDEGFSTSTAYSGIIYQEGIYQYQDIYVSDTSETILLPDLYIDQDGLAERQ